MNHQSSYKAPRNERSVSGGSSYTSRNNRNKKRSPYTRRTWRDNKFLFNLIVFVLPFILINGLILLFATSTPRIELTINDTKDYKTLDISFKVKSLLPVKSLTATLESQKLELTREKNTYSASLTNNGVLDIQVKGWNGMNASAYEHIATLDDRQPTVSDDYTLANNILTITVDDIQSGVDYSALYGIDANGQTVKPTATDPETGSVVFAMDTPSLTVYIPDYVGNVLQASYSNRTEGIDTSKNNASGAESGNGSGKNSAGSSNTTETTKSKETTKTKETTKAAAKTKETTKAKATTKAKETTKAKATTKAKETTKAKATTKAKETSKAKETTKAKETSNAKETTDAPTAPAVSPVETSPQGPGHTPDSPDSPDANAGETVPTIPIG